MHAWVVLPLAVIPGVPLAVGRPTGRGSWLFSCLFSCSTIVGCCCLCQRLVGQMEHLCHCHLDHHKVESRKAATFVLPLFPPPPPRWCHTPHPPTGSRSSCACPPRLPDGCGGSCCFSVFWLRHKLHCRLQRTHFIKRILKQIMSH